MVTAKRKKKNLKKIKRKKRSGNKYLTQKEIQKLLALLRKKNTRANSNKKMNEWIIFVYFMNELGTRVKEYSHLKWKDFHFNSYPVWAKIKRNYTKTKAGVRNIYIYDVKLIELL